MNEIQDYRHDRVKAFDCISPTTFIEKHEEVPVKSSLKQLKTLCEFYNEDISSEEIVLVQYKNMHALLDAWEFGKGEAILRDT